MIAKGKKYNKVLFMRPFASLNPLLTRFLEYIESNVIEIAEKTTAANCPIIPVATKNASVSEFAPQNAAITDCFIKPRNLITKVTTVTEIDENIMLFLILSTFKPNPRI